MKPETVLRKVGTGQAITTGPSAPAYVGVGAAVGGAAGALAAIAFGESPWGLITGLGVVVGAMGGWVKYQSANATPESADVNSTPSNPSGYAGSSSGTPTSGSGGVFLPAGPYTNLGKGAKLLDGHTYLMSSPSENPTSATAAFQGVGYTVLGSWAAPPAGWPSDETATSGAFMAVTAKGAAQTNGQDVTTWATGGATT